MACRTVLNMEGAPLEETRQREEDDAVYLRSGDALHEAHHTPLLARVGRVISGQVAGAAETRLLRASLGRWPCTPGRLPMSAGNVRESGMSFGDEIGQGSSGLQLPLYGKTARHWSILAWM